MSEKLKISVIGTGHLGSIHARLWKSASKAELIGIYDLDKEKTKKLSAEFTCRAFDNLDEVLSSSEAVTIAVPTTLHYEIATECIKKGIHCLIEKPITSTYEEASKLIELSKKYNVLLQVGHVERFNPALASLKNYNLNPLFIEAHRLSQFRMRATDVSVIHDLMIHDIDIMLWLIKSEVEKIDANGVGVLTDNCDIANARIKFKNGAVANLTASRISARPMRKMRLFQNKSYISIDFDKKDVEVFSIIPKSEPVKGNIIPAVMLGAVDESGADFNITFEKPEILDSNAIVEEQKAFIDAVCNNSKIAVSAEEAAEALRIAEIISEQISNKNY